MRRAAPTPASRRGPTLALAALLTALTACPAAPGPRPAPRARPSTLPPIQAGSAKVYRGPDGILLSMLRLQDGTYLLRVTGSTHRLDGKVIRCTFLREGDGLHAWTTPYDGYDLVLLKRRMKRQQGPVYLLNLPGERFLQNQPLAFDVAATAALRPGDLVAGHEAQLADGSLGRILSFDVQARIRQEEKAIARDVAQTNRKCTTQLRLTVDWAAIAKKSQYTMAVRDRCDEPLSALRQFCNDAVAQETLRKHLREVRCRVVPGEALGLRLEGPILHYTVGRKVKNRRLRVLRRLAEDIRWPGGETMARLIYRARHHLCTDGKGHFVGYRPARAPDKWAGYERRMHYGTAGRFTEVPFARYLGEHWFFDPRHKSKWNRMHWRGFNMENYSMLDWNPRTGRCLLFCGTRKVVLRAATPAETAKALAGATWAPPRPRRQPHGLARDRQGNYFYVDKAAGNAAKDYRLYRGPLGRLKQLQMLNIVSDTEGEVYSTKNGTLRLVLEKEHSFWVERGRKKTLINVPIGKNQALIYNELGVYLGQPFGTPCDLF